MWAQVPLKARRGYRLMKVCMLRSPRRATKDLNWWAISPVPWYCILKYGKHESWILLIFRNGYGIQTTTWSNTVRSQHKVKSYFAKRSSGIKMQFDPRPQAKNLSFVCWWLHSGCKGLLESESRMRLELSRQTVCLICEAYAQCSQTNNTPSQTMIPNRL